MGRAPPAADPAAWTDSRRSFALMNTASPRGGSRNSGPCLYQEPTLPTHILLVPARRQGFRLLGVSARLVEVWRLTVCGSLRACRLLGEGRLPLGSTPRCTFAPLQEDFM